MERNRKVREAASWGLLIGAACLAGGAAILGAEDVLHSAAEGQQVQDNKVEAIVMFSGSVICIGGIFKVRQGLNQDVELTVNQDVDTEV